MALENMNSMLMKAMTDKYAVGAFNILDYNSTKAVVAAAEELHAPVIIQTSVKTVKFWGYQTIISWLKELAGNISIPVAIHLDHCKDIEVIQKCIDAGWTSIMIDASAKPFAENITLSQQVVEIARPKNVSVEAELGEIGGVEEDKIVAEQDAHLVDPDKAIKFCRQVKPDCFAPAIGTAHGIYKGEPRLAYDRLEVIARSTQIPIALHGGTGLSNDVFIKCIALGCAKINISTQLKHTFIDAFMQYQQSKPAEYEPVKLLAYQFEQLKADVKEKIKLFGSAGKAS
ncbi:class II fructose-bisphosphate aldolase [candidate division KSB1 bacterium]|nr:class II fructose-bisphosphate aldolase [candidate division KSB1 bacterium]